MKNELKNYKINIYYLLGIFFIFSITKPAFFSNIDVMNYLYNVSKIILYVISGIYVLKKIINKECKISSITFLIIIFYLLLIISTIINNQKLVTVVQYCSMPILLVLMIDTLNKDRLIHFLNGMSTMLFLLTCINLITVILFPSGMEYNKLSVEKYFFLGHNNSVIRIIFPGIIFSAVYDYSTYNKLKLKTYLFTGLTMLMVVITWSNTAMIGMFILIIFEIFLYNKKIEEVLNAKTMFLILIFLFLFLVIFQNMDVMQNIIVNVFHKDITLSGRTVIWENSIPIIKERFWFGYGNNASMPDISNWEYEPSSFHNYFLDLAFKGGISLVIVQLLIIWNVCVCLEKSKTNMSNFLKFALLSYFVMWQLEPFMSIGYITMMGVFIICNKCNILEMD